MVTNQAYLFFVFILNGIAIGLLFDFFRIIRKVFQTRDYITYLEDILFWILTGFMILASAFIFNNGQLRFFMFLAIIVGAIIYMIFISSYVIKINIKMIMILKKILGIISVPFQMIGHLLGKTFLNPVHFLFINIRKSFTNFGIKIYTKINKTKKVRNIVKS